MMAASYQARHTALVSSGEIEIFSVIVCEIERYIERRRRSSFMVLPMFIRLQRKARGSDHKTEHRVHYVVSYKNPPESALKNAFN